MNHSIDRCRVCENYLRGLERCKYCQFEWATDYPPTIDVPFDIFDLDDNVEWVHLQILDRLHYKGIDCLFADMWIDDLAILIGCDATNREIADALHIHEEVVYRDGVHGLIILDLFQEKWLRGELEDENELFSYFAHGKYIMTEDKWDNLKCDRCGGELKLIKDTEFESVKECNDCQYRCMLIRKIRSNNDGE